MGKKKASQEPRATGWDRTQLTLRLSGRRKELLRAVADRESPGCSPTDAIDRVLDLAFAARAAADGTEELARLSAIEEAFDAAEARRTAEAARLENTIKVLAQSMASLHALLAQLASEEPAC